MSEAITSNVAALALAGSRQSDAVAGGEDVSERMQLLSIGALHSELCNMFDTQAFERDAVDVNSSEHVVEMGADLGRSIVWHRIWLARRFGALSWSFETGSTAGLRYWQVKQVDMVNR